MGEISTKFPIEVFLMYKYIFINYYNKREHTKEQKEANLKLYRGILSQVSNFKKSIEEFGDDFESIMDLIGVVSSNGTIRSFWLFPLDGKGISKRTAARHK